MRPSRIYPRLTDDMLDIIENKMMGGHKNTPSAAAARSVLVDGLSVPEAVALHSIASSSLVRALQHRLSLLEAAHQLVCLHGKCNNK